MEPVVCNHMSRDTVPRIPNTCVLKENVKTPLTKQLEPEPPSICSRFSYLTGERGGPGGIVHFRFPPTALRRFRRAKAASKSMIRECPGGLLARVVDPSTRESGFWKTWHATVCAHGSMTLSTSKVTFRQRRCSFHKTKNLYSYTIRRRVPSEHAVHSIAGNYSFTRSRATATSLTLVPVGPVNTRPPTSFRAL